MSSGLPDYVIGNWFDLPSGTSRLYLTVHTTQPIESSPASASMWSRSCTKTPGVSAFSFSGRFNMSVAVPALSVRMTKASLMIAA